jgi:hypothetical protein
VIAPILLQRVDDRRRGGLTCVYRRMGEAED